MLKLKFFIIVTLYVTIGIYSMANSPEGKSSITESVHHVILSQHKHSKRPSIPSKDYIVCSYEMGYMEFSFPQSVHYIIVQLNNDNDEWTGVVTMDEPYVYIPQMIGEYIITCTDQNNRIFSGTVIF